jgi:hypothetical protein
MLHELRDMNLDEDILLAAAKTFVITVDFSDLAVVSFLSQSHTVYTYVG